VIAAYIVPTARLPVHRYSKAIRAVGDVGKPELSRDDWAAGIWSYLSVWALPKVVIVVASFAPVPVRTVVLVVALAWMGSACIMNSRRCGRVHCRYTGPFYVALTIPVLLVGTGLFQPGNYAWIILGVLSVFGGFLITWVTEAAWGRYENSSCAS